MSLASFKLKNFLSKISKNFFQRKEKRKKLHEKKYFQFKNYFSGREGGSYIKSIIMYF